MPLRFVPYDESGHVVDGCYDAVVGKYPILKLIPVLFFLLDIILVILTCIYELPEYMYGFIFFNFEINQTTFLAITCEPHGNIINHVAATISIVDIENEIKINDYCCKTGFRYTMNFGILCIWMIILLSTSLETIQYMFVDGSAICQVIAYRSLIGFISTISINLHTAVHFRTVQKQFLSQEIRKQKILAKCQIGIYQEITSPTTDLDSVIVPIQTIDTPTNCVICLDDFVPSVQVVKLPCKHIYHESCGSCHFDTKSDCPICRKQVLTL